MIQATKPKKLSQSQIFHNSNPSSDEDERDEEI